MAALAGMPLERALLDFTNVYIRFGFGRAFDPEHSGWRAYVDGARATSDLRAWTYETYLRGPREIAPPRFVAAFGCFSYGALDAGRIRLHFRDAETGGHSPLAKQRCDRRMSELGALVRHATATQGRHMRVVGASWLYNIEAYRRLFPGAYLATARVAGDRFRNMPLWGQFLDRRGEVREAGARDFRERLARQTSLDGIAACFPFQVLTLEAPIAVFAAHYGV